MKLEIICNIEDVKKFKIATHKFEKLKLEDHKLTKSKSLLIVSTPTENINDARILDKYINGLDTEISYKLITIDSSAYFNRVLYPLINEFERLLRKILYLRVEITGTDFDVINELESKDFGEIFSILFVDEGYSLDFYSSIKTNFKKMTKRDFIKLLNDKVEETIWNKMFGHLDFNLIEEHSHEIRKIRNSVMHAHNITYEQYDKYRKLIEAMNGKISFYIEIIRGMDVAPRQDNLITSLIERITSVSNNLHEENNFANQIFRENNIQAFYKLSETFSKLKELMDVQDGIQIDD